RVAASRVRLGIPGRLAADRKAAPAHVERPRNRATSGCAAVFEHPGVASTVSPPAEVRDDAGLGPHKSSELIDRARILERAQIAEVVLAEVRPANDPAQDFRVACLRQLRDEAHGLGSQWLAED